MAEMEEKRLVRFGQMNSHPQLGTRVAYVIGVMKLNEKFSEQLFVCSCASGGGVLILALGMGIAYLLFVLTGAII